MFKAPNGNNYRVISYSLKRDRLIRVGLVSVYIGALIFAYYWGGWREAETNARLSQQNNELLVGMKHADVAQEKYLKEVARLKHARDIDRLALESVRGLIKALEGDKAQLTEELVFYHNIMAPENAASGIRLYNLRLRSDSTAAGFQLRFVIAQISSDKEFRKGKISVSIEGVQGGKEISLSLLKLSGLENSSLSLGFRYFQMLPANKEFLKFKLPSDFTPESIRIVVNMRGDRKNELDKVFNWNEELAANVEMDFRESKTKETDAEKKK